MKAFSAEIYLMTSLLRINCLFAKLTMKAFQA